MTPQQSQFKADRFSNYAYAVIVPQSGASYAEQAADIVAQIQQHFADKQIVRQTVFLRDPNRLDETAQLFAAQQGAAQPLTAFVSQAPADGNLLAAEIVAVSGAEVTRVNNSLTTVQHNGITFVHTQADAYLGGKAPRENAYADTLAVLNDNIALLKQGGARLDQVFRTWFYMGNIVAPDNRVANQEQRYKELNRARTDAFGDTAFLKGSLKSLKPIVRLP